MEGAETIDRKFNSKGSVKGLKIVATENGKNRLKSLKIAVKMLEISEKDDMLFASFMSLSLRKLAK
jgi:hypothetical protein